MKYYLVKLVTNTEGQVAPSVTAYDTKEAALVAYHQILAAYHNAADVYYAIAEIINGYGDVEIKEIVDHIPTPEPEEEVPVIG